MTDTVFIPNVIGGILMIGKVPIYFIDRIQVTPDNSLIAVTNLDSKSVRKFNYRRSNYEVLHKPTKIQRVHQNPIAGNTDSPIANLLHKKLEEDTRLDTPHILVAPPKFIVPLMYGKDTLSSDKKMVLGFKDYGKVNGHSRSVINGKEAIITDNNIVPTGVFFGWNRVHVLSDYIPNEGFKQYLAQTLKSTYQDVAASELNIINTTPSEFEEYHPDNYPE
mgnify:CR=1 FL=1